MIWCRIFFCKHSKSPLKSRQHHHVWLRMSCYDVTMQVHESSHAIIRCDAYTIWQWKQNGHVARFHQRTKTFKNIHEARPSSSKNRITSVLIKVERNCVGKILLEIVHPFLKKIRPPKLYFYRKLGSLVYALTLRQLYGCSSISATIWVNQPP